MRVRIPAVAAVGAVAALSAQLAGSDLRFVHACLLAAAIVIGELLVLRLEDGTGIPLSYAPLLLIVAGFEPRDAAAIWIAGSALAFAVRVDGRGVRGRGVAALQRLLVGAAAIVVYRGVFEALDRRESLPAVLSSIAAATVAAVLADDLARRAQGLGSSVTPRGVRAWSALISAGALMALGYRGVDGEGGTGLWSVALFSIPLLAAWYSFERLAAVSRTHRQTLRALSMATELGGFVPDGHGRRVADLCEQIAAEVGFSGTEIDDIVAAAYLHHLGVVTLDDPPSDDDPARVGIVADVTAGMLREIPALQSAGLIVATQARYARDLAGAGDSRLAGQVLKVASDFDDLAGPESSRAGLALEALYASPGYVYDRRVLEALEFVVSAR
jgi:hypothetical protein